MTAEDLVAALRQDGLRVAIAESCTGGLVAGRLTDVPGAGDVFTGGLVAYDDGVKERHLGVPSKVLRGSGAVSASCAEAMAHGARGLFGTEMAIAVTGLAGPGGGSLRKPVGTVWIAVLGPEHLLRVHKLKLKGGRDAIRRQTVDAALGLALENLREGEREGVAVPAEG